MNAIKPGYAKIMHGVYRRGKEAAAIYARIKLAKTVPKPPYKRQDFRKMWQIGFDEAAKNICKP